jgi:transcription antitermination factor NusG
MADQIENQTEATTTDATAPAKAVDVFQVHDAARILTGKYAGTVGTVTEVRESSVRVQIEGVKDEQPVSAHPWLKPSQLGRNHGA